MEHSASVILIGMALVLACMAQPNHAHGPCSLQHLYIATERASGLATLLSAHEVIVCRPCNRQPIYRKSQSPSILYTG